MKKNQIFLFLTVFFVQWGFSQKAVMQTILETGASIRAIELYKGKVYYAGSKSLFGFVDVENPAQHKEIVLQKEPADFRTIARLGSFLYTIGIGKPAKFYRVRAKDLQTTPVGEDVSPTAFYDALHAVDGKLYTFSDPDESLALKFIRFNFLHDTMVKKLYAEPKLFPGESAFAASNSNIASNKKYVFLASGGQHSRIFRLNRRIGTLETIEVPIIQGKATTGMYTLDVAGDFLIAAGGDYTQQADNKNNIIVSHNSGASWTVVASGKNLGYKTCVKILPGSKGKIIAALGDQGLELSKDFGQTWTVLSTEKNLYTLAWKSKKLVVAAGNKRIVCFTLAK